MKLKESIVIGILGRARVGKDTVANMLLENFHYEFPHIRSVIFRAGDLVKMRLAQLTGGTYEAIESSKETAEGRWLLENFGEFLGRGQILDHITKQVDAAIPNKMLIIVTGIRRLEESNLIRDVYNGLVIAVFRKTGLEVQPTEVDVNKIIYDYPLENNDSLIRLGHYVKDAFCFILHHSKIKPKIE